jgi:hypothetical protein
LQDNTKNNENNLESYKNDDNLPTSALYTFGDTNLDLNSSFNSFNPQPILYNIPYYTNTNTLSIPSQPTFSSINTIPNNRYSSYIPQDQLVYNYSSIPNDFNQFTYNNHIELTRANSNSFNQTPPNNDNMSSQEYF